MTAYLGPAIAPGIGAPDVYVVACAFAGIAVLVAILALTHHVERAFSPAMIYLGMGALGAIGVALLDAPWLAVVDDASVIEHISEGAVVVALFATGLRLDHALTLREWRSTVLLLGVVMPISIAGVALLGVWVAGLSIGGAIVLAAALAPTDPVLAGDLGVFAPGEGDRSEPAFALTSEAGLNDGLAFPFVFLGLVVASGGGGAAYAEWLAADVLYAVGAGIGIGAAVGWGIAAGAVRLRDRGLLAAGLDGWAAVGAVLAIYGIAEIAGAYGFLAAFAGGIAFRRYERDHEYNDGVHAGAEALERALELTMILLLGSLLTLEGLGEAGWEAVAIALALILVIRPLATMAGLRGSGLAGRERLYVGIFGIRGIGSVYYATAAFGSGLLAAGEGARIIWIVVVAVCLSIVLHGASASVLTRRMVPGGERPGEPGEVETHTLA
jgi:NhaP-type Na+/H+ or K+/H+ antiporter